MKRAVLEHPHRGRILTHLAAQPGSSLQDLADHLGVHRNAAAHHVRVLAAHQKVVTLRQGRVILHFPAETRPERRLMVGLMRTATVRSVLQALVADPSVSWRRMARNLNLTPHTVRWHVQRMERDGLIELQHGLGGRVVALHPEARALLDAPAPAAAPSGPAPAPAMLDLPSRRA